MRVLSLFDGIACGRLALDRAGVHVASYLASEVDPHCISLVGHRHRDVVQLGDARCTTAARCGTVDLLMGGPPCQSFSIAGDRIGFEDRRGSMVMEYVRVLREVRPRWFLMENVVMHRDHQEQVSELLGVEPLLLDSGLVSAQQRRRLYWTNIPDVVLPTQCGEVLADVVGVRDSRPRSTSPVQVGLAGGKPGQGNRVYGLHGKSPTLSASSGGTAGPANLLVEDGRGSHRCLTVSECERLQTLPEGYTDRMVGTARRRAIGNCWTVDAVAWILAQLPA